MNQLEIKIKKEKVKEMAKNSVLFLASDDALSDFIKAVDIITEDEQGNSELDSLTAKFIEEKDSIINNYKDILGK
jgi:hypothetical protein